jgi:hypothetical protein
MRAVLFMHSFSGYFRQFEPALRELLQRGHEVHVVRDREDTMRGESWAQSLQAEFPHFTWTEAPPPHSDSWFALKRHVRLVSDYLYFLRPEYGQSIELVRRARKRTPRRVRHLLDDPHSRWRRPANLRRASRILSIVDGAMPPSPVLREFIREQSPDVVLLTPHLMPGSIQQDALRSALEVRVPTAMCIASWDNLSSKQLIRVVPDVVTVWNETQRAEASSIHGLPPDRVVATGAQAYDPWFRWQARSREEFCARVGLPADRPYVLYVGGALFRADITEAEFVIERWLPALRTSDHPELRDAAVLIRPHPKRFGEWSAVELGGLDAVSLWPQEGRMPVDADARADFYDSIHHSAGVFGLNTSAMIEAGVVGKRVHTLLVPEFEGSQHGTLHFRYLTGVGGGLLREASSFAEHFDQLAESVRAGGAAVDGNRRFIEAFVRPHGIEVAAAAVFADAIEQLATRVPLERPGPSSAQLVLRAALAPASAGLRLSRARRLARKRRRAGTATRYLDGRRAQKAATTAFGVSIVRATAAVRHGSDRERELYVAMRKTVAPRITRARAQAARGQLATGIRIPESVGYAVLAPDGSPGIGEIVTYAQERVARMSPTAHGPAGNLVAMSPAAPGRASPLLRLALREDLLATISAYLGTTPLLSSIDLYASLPTNGVPSAGQLLHCDPEDTRQVKVFVLCSDVAPEHGPLTIMSASDSRELRRRTGYRYGARLTDAQASATLGGHELCAVEGPAGTMCLFDSSRCFHYGSRLRDDASPRIAAVIQYLSPHSFMLPRDVSLTAPFKHLARAGDSDFVRMVLGASRPARTASPRSPVASRQP